MNIFKIDGPVNKVTNILYYLIISNLLWIVFSLPVLTVGASSTALFYVMSRIIRGEDVSVFKYFYASFRLNFKQSTIVWLILLPVYVLLYFNLNSSYLIGDIFKYLIPVQILVLIEIIIVTIYIFPLLSRYDMTVPNLFKTSFYLGNRHILTTIICALCTAAHLYLFYIIPGVILPFIVSLYALYTYFFINRIFRRYNEK